MSDLVESSCAAAASERAVTVRAAVTKAVILLGLTVWAFWSEFRIFAAAATRSSDWAHVLAVPVAILLLILRRRRHLAAALTRGTPVGIVIILCGFVLYAASTWPFDFGYARYLSVIPVIAGIILAVCGWRVLKLCVPMLLLLFLSIPIGERAYAALIIRPETRTLSATRFVLDQLPAVEVKLDGPDLNFVRHGHSGTVALGEPRRGASLLVTYVVIGVFVVFSRVRPFWQVAVLALAAGPISLACSFLRIVCAGVITVYALPDPTSSMPRSLAAVVSLLMAYLLFGLGCWLLGHLTVECEDVAGDALEADRAE